MTTLETATDREAESATIKRISEMNTEILWGKYPQFSYIDYVGILNWEVVGFIEVKSRKEAADKVRQYGGLLLKQSKWNELRHAEESFRVPAYAVFSFEGGHGEIYRARPALLPDRDGVLTGRRDRNLATDLEPVVLIDWDTELERIA